MDECVCRPDDFEGCVDHACPACDDDSILRPCRAWTKGEAEWLSNLTVVRDG